MQRPFRKGEDYHEKDLPPNQLSPEIGPDYETTRIKRNENHGL